MDSNIPFDNSRLNLIPIWVKVTQVGECQVIGSGDRYHCNHWLSLFSLSLFIFLQKKIWFSGFFSILFGQPSVAEAWTTPSPWSIDTVLIQTPPTAHPNQPHTSSWKGHSLLVRKLMQGFLSVLASGGDYVCDSEVWGQFVGIRVVTCQVWTVKSFV